MSLLDVFSGRQSFGSWLTGRDPKEADVYANYDKVSEVSEALRNISKNQVTTAQESIYAAFEQLNAVHGLAEYVGTIEVGNYDTVFESISTTIDEIANQLEGKAADIKTYESASIFEKIGSTAFMGVCKVGEGLLSVVEDLGDGVLSVIGWGAGVLGAKGVQDSIANTIKNDWSHDIFNGYYNSDFAKKSIFTEDSALAGACKIAGKTVGYLYAGGAISGLTGLKGATNVGVGIFKASGSTWGATIAGATGGLGSGTESGLKSGLSYNQAMGLGLLTGGIQGGLAFAGGKLGEKLAKNAALKDASKAANQADDTLNAAQKSMDSAQKTFNEAQNKLNELWNAGANDKAIAAQETIVNQADDALKAAKTAFDSAKTAADAAKTSLDAVSKSSISNFQGYSDRITQAGERFGEATRNTVKSGVDALRSTASASHAIRKGTIDASAKSAEATAAQDAFKGNLKTLAHENPVAQGAGAIKNSVSNTAANIQANGVAGAIGNSLNNAKGAASAAISSIKTNGVVGAAKAAASAVSPATPGVVATALGSTVNETVNAAGVQNEKQLNTLGKLNETAQSGDKLFEESFVDKDHSTTPPTTSPGTTANTTVPGTVANTTVPGTASPPDGGYTPPGGNPPDGGYTPPGGSENPTQPPTQPTTPPTTVPPTQPTQPTPPTDPTPTTEPTQPTPPSEPTPTTEPTPPGGGNPPGGTTYTVTPGADPGGTTYTVAPGDSSHSGVAYDGETMESDSLELENAEDLDLLDMEMDEEMSSLDDIVGGNQYTKIPTSNKPVTTSNKRSSSSVIPIAAGLSVAAAAGIGAKAYMDRKRNNDMDDDEEYEDDDFDSEEWSGDEDTVELDYSSPSAGNEDDYLEDDNYYQEDSGYTARSSNELADLQ